jgi:hypothetical protein
LGFGGSGGSSGAIRARFRGDQGTIDLPIAWQGRFHDYLKLRIEHPRTTEVF